MNEEQEEIRPIEEILDQPLTEAELRHYGAVLAELRKHEGWAVFERMLNGYVAATLENGLVDESKSRAYWRGRLDATRGILAWTRLMADGGTALALEAKEAERRKGVHPNLWEENENMEGVALPFHSMFDRTGE